MTPVKPIFLVGLGRSGTTVLYNLIANHEKLCWISAKDNEKIFPKDFLEKEKERQTEDRKKGIISGGELSLMFFGMEGREKNQAWNVIKDPNQIPVEGVHIFDHFFGQDFDVRVSKKSKNFKDFVTRVCEEKNKSRFINKNPENIKRLEVLNEIFPDALFVCMIRDPIPCVNSMILRVRKEGNAYYNGIPTLGANLDELNDVEYASLNLKQNLEIAFNFKAKLQNRFYFMFYENLVKSTKEEIKKLLDFLELSQPKEFIKNLPELKDMNIKWKKNLTKDEVNTIVKTLSNTVTKLKLPYDLKKMIP